MPVRRHTPIPLPTHCFHSPTCKGIILAFFYFYFVCLFCNLFFLLLPIFRYVHDSEANNVLAVDDPNWFANTAGIWRAVDCPVGSNKMYYQVISSSRCCFVLHLTHTRLTTSEFLHPSWRIHQTLGSWNNNSDHRFEHINR